MIPKILHFIWIGQKPQYVDYAVDAYRNCNPHCAVNLIHYTNLQLENLYFNKDIKTEQDQQVYNLLVDIIYGNKYSQLTKILILGIEHINYAYTPFIQLFCDILRLELLNIYGGIYIDCDTYPIKPFDDAIFQHDKFCVYDKVNDAITANNYFIGAKAGQAWKNYFDKDCDIVVQHNNYEFISRNKDKPFDYLLRRVKFFKCALKQTDFINYKTNDYFEHYSEFRWGTGKIQLTKFDDIFDKAQFYR